MERERKVQRKALSMKRATKKTQGKTRALDSQTSSHSRVSDEFRRGGL